MSWEDSSNRVMELVSIFLSLFRCTLSLQKKWPIAAAILSITKGMGVGLGGGNNLKKWKSSSPHWGPLLFRSLHLKGDKMKGQKSVAPAHTWRRTLSLWPQRGPSYLTTAPSDTGVGGKATCKSRGARELLCSRPETREQDRRLDFSSLL